MHGENFMESAGQFKSLLRDRGFLSNMISIKATDFEFCKIFVVDVNGTFFLYRRRGLCGRF